MGAGAAGSCSGNAVAIPGDQSSCEVARKAMGHTEFEVIVGPQPIDPNDRPPGCFVRSSNTDKTWFNSPSTTSTAFSATYLQVCVPPTTGIKKIMLENFSFQHVRSEWFQLRNGSPSILYIFTETEIKCAH